MRNSCVKGRDTGLQTYAECRKALTWPSVSTSAAAPGYPRPAAASLPALHDICALPTPCLCLAVKATVPHRSSKHNPVIAARNYKRGVGNFEDIDSGRNL